MQAVNRGHVLGNVGHSTKGIDVMRYFHGFKALGVIFGVLRNHGNVDQELIGGAKNLLPVRPFGVKGIQKGL